MEKASRRQLQYCSSSNKVSCPSLTKNLISMAKHGAVKQFEKVERVAVSIRKKYKSLREAHRKLGSFSWKRWHSICKPKKELHTLRRITFTEKKEIIALWQSPEVSVTLPFKKLAKKKFMIITICEAYQKYIMIQKKGNAESCLFHHFTNSNPKTLNLGDLCHSTSVPVPIVVISVWREML